LDDLSESCSIEEKCGADRQSADLAARPAGARQGCDEVRQSINTYFFPLGDDLKEIVVGWIDELQKDHLFGPNDPLFPKTKMKQDEDKSFRPAGIEPSHWSDSAPVRAIFWQAFTAAGLPYFPPHSLRHNLGHLMHMVCRTPRQIKAWSQNLGHENIATTLTSYGTIDPHRQGEIIGGVSLEEAQPDGAVLAKIRALVGA
jgi:integrase